MKQKPITIKNFKQLLNTANDENIDNLAITIAYYLHSYNALISKIKKKFPELANRKNTEILPFNGLDYINDGKFDCTFNIVDADGNKICISSHPLTPEDLKNTTDTTEEPN
jgi:hypothetical protein